VRLLGVRLAGFDGGEAPEADDAPEAQMQLGLTA
jgi:hypothetical protein